MPELWFKNADPDLSPYSVPYTEGQSVEAITAAHTAGGGWSLFEPDDDDAIAAVSPPASPASVSVPPLPDLSTSKPSPSPDLTKE